MPRPILSVPEIHGLFGDVTMPTPMEEDLKPRDKRRIQRFMMEWIQTLQELLRQEVVSPEQLQSLSLPDLEKLIIRLEAEVSAKVANRS